LYDVIEGGRFGCEVVADGRVSNGCRPFVTWSRRLRAICDIITLPVRFFFCAPAVTRIDNFRTSLHFAAIVWPRRGAQRLFES
jgi:hypothetical protein